MKFLRATILFGCLSGRGGDYPNTLDASFMAGL